MMSLLHGQALVCRALIRGWQEPLTPAPSFNPCPAAAQTSTEEADRQKGKKKTKTGGGMCTHTDDVVEPPHVLDGAAEVQAVEGLSQRAISVAL